MAITLPAGFAVRAATSGDLQEITGLARACELTDMGRAETLPADIEDWWEDMTLATDTFVLLAHTGQIVGYAGVSVGHSATVLDPHTSLHPEFRRENLEHTLLDLAENRARQLLVEAELSFPRKLRGYAFNEIQRQSLVQAGFIVTSSDINLEIFLEEQPAEPQPVSGIFVRLYQPEQDEHAIHAVIQETFQEIGGHPYQPFEDWTEGVTEHAHFDPQLLFVALDGDQIVGTISCRTFEYAQEGHITQLGVLQPWRKRGIARHLMQQVFVAFYLRDFRHITISVDAHNTTGARQLYEAMGMKQYEQVDYMLKSL